MQRSPAPFARTRSSRTQVPARTTPRAAAQARVLTRATPEAVAARATVSAVVRAASAMGQGEEIAVSSPASPRSYPSKGAVLEDRAARTPAHKLREEEAEARSRSP